MQIADLKGGLQGLQASVDSQARRLEASDVRFRRWRKVIDEDCKAKFLQLEQEVERLPPRDALVSRDDLLEVVDLLKRELKALVEDAVSLVDGETATRQELVDVAEAIQQQMSEFAASSAFGPGAGAVELVEATAALRRELLILAERKPDAGSDTRLNDLEREAERHRRNLMEFAERADRSDHSVSDFEQELRRFAADLRALKQREAEFELVTRAEAERLAEKVVQRHVGDGRRFSPKLGSFPAHGEGFDDSATLAWPSSPQQRVESLEVLLTSATMRLEALEGRQQHMRQEMGEDAALRLSSEKQVEVVVRRCDKLDIRVAQIESTLCCPTGSRQ